MTKALMRGGRQFFGWGQAEYAMANVYDAINLNTQATGHWRNKPPKFEPYPAPKNTKPAATAQAKSSVSVEDVFLAFHKRG